MTHNFLLNDARFVSSVSLSGKEFHGETARSINGRFSSKLNVASIYTARSFAETTGRNSFPSKVTCKFRSAGVFEAFDGCQLKALSSYLG